MKTFIANRENRKQEVMEFFGYPSELVDVLFKYSKEYFEGAWGSFYPDYVDSYYEAGFYIIRQMSYLEKQIFPGNVSTFLEEVNGSVLDYGCGVGDHLIYLAKKGVKCYAVEHPGVPVEFLKYRFKKHNVDVTIISNEFLPDVDYTLLISALDHLEDPIGKAMQICQITKKKIFATPCIDENYDRPTHIKEILKDVPRAFEVISEHNKAIS